MSLTSVPEKEQYYFPERLKEQLAHIMVYPMTVVVAPFGSGKTTAVREYLNQHFPDTTSVCWYTSFGESPDTAWDQICSMIGRIDRKTAASLRGLGYPVRETLAMFTGFLQEADCDKETVLVIDNYHLLKSEIAHELIGAMALHGNEHLHLVLISQQLDDKPIIPLSIPYTFYIASQTFFFHSEDIAAYFQLYGISLGTEELNQIMDSTFGWVAALKLQLLSYLQSGELDQQVGVDRLLRTVFWNNLSTEGQDFLISLSLFKSVTVRQASIMAGSERLPEYAENVLSDRLFLEFDQNKRCFVVHTILREFLNVRFEELSESRKKVYYSRAGAAYAYMDNYYEAARYYLKAGALEALLAMPVRNTELAQLNSEQVDEIVTGIMNDCPRALMYHRPQPLLVLAFEQLQRGKRISFELLCEVVNQALAQADLFSAEEHHQIYGEYMFLRSFTYFNDIKQMSRMHKKALAELKGSSQLFDFHYSWTSGIPSVLYLYWNQCGKLDEIKASIVNDMVDYMALTGGHGKGGGVLLQAEALLHEGELDRAEALCYKALYMGQSAQQDGVCFGAELTLARIAILQKDFKSYEEYRTQMNNRLQGGKEKIRHLTADQCQAYLLLLLGETEGVAQWLSDEREIEQKTYGMSAGFAMMLHGKLSLLKQEYNKVIGMAPLITESAPHVTMIMAEIYSDIFCACAYFSTRQEEKGLRYLEKALKLALPDRIYLPFAEHAEVLEPYLCKLMEKSEDQSGWKELLALCKKQMEGVSEMRKGTNNYQHVLTKREYEVAELVRQGLTNKEIAERLFITSETVKMALKKIFVKLSISSRIQLMDKKLDCIFAVGGM